MVDEDGSYLYMYGGHRRHPEPAPEHHRRYPRAPGTLEQWFNRNAFARPASGTFGNMGRNSLRGPGIHKWDLTLFKNFRIDEHVRLQFRAEAFNAFNHPSFVTVGRTLTTTATV